MITLEEQADTVSCKQNPITMRIEHRGNAPFLKNGEVL